MLLKTKILKCTCLAPMRVACICVCTKVYRRLSPRCRRVLFVLMSILFLLITSIVYMTTVCLGGCPAPVRSPGPYITYFNYREWRENKVKTLLFWTPNYGDPLWGQEGKDTFGKCPISDCKLTSDKKELDNADAVLFHSRAVWNYFIGYSLPSHHPPHQVWIINNGEPPPHVYLNMKAYNNVFNWTFWYREEADIPTVTGRMVRISNESITWKNEPDKELRAAGQSVRDVTKPAVGPQKVTHNYYKDKNYTAAWVASNCKDQGRRLRLIRRLQKYMSFDTYGACGDKTLPCSDIRCGQYLDSFRFYFSFENSKCRDYVTEKFWNALDRGQIPIVYGGAVYDNLIPNNAYINVDSFDSMEDLAYHIKEVASNVDMYNSYHWWRKYYKIQITPGPWCDLCQAVHDKSRPAQTYSDLDGWYRNDICPQFSVTDIVSRFVEGMFLKYNIIS